MVKPRSKQAAHKSSSTDNTAIEALADKLADKPYGEQTTNEDVNGPVSLQQAGEDIEEMQRISISLPRSMRYLLEDIAMERKRAKEPSRSVSAITRDALEDYFKKIERA